MNDIQFKFSTHGREQLELSLTCNLDKTAKSEYLRAELYFFIPAQLGLDGSGSYRRDNFIKDLLVYTRYNPPSIPLSKLADLDCSISPVSRILRMVQTSAQTIDIPKESIMYELRTNVNAFHIEIKKSRKLMEELNYNENGKCLQKLVDIFLKELDDFLHSTRKLYFTFADTRISQNLREALRWSDEAISIKTEKELYRLYNVLKNQNLMDLADKVKLKHAEEDRYKRKMSFATFDSQKEPIAAENYLYRTSILKKWAQGVMYLDNRSYALSNHLFHIFAGAAAATAMAFAVFATFLAGAIFEGYSLPWIILIVLSYIFKDRIKELMREGLVMLIPRIVPQMLHKLVDPAANRKVGISSQNVYFIPLQKVPEVVRQLREINLNPFREILPPENVIALHTGIKVYSKKLLKNHGRVNSITEIFRLKISDWLKEMDDPVEELGTLCGEDDSKQYSVKRVYHINVVLKIRFPEAITIRKRLIFNRRGILRVEDITPTA